MADAGKPAATSSVSVALLALVCALLLLTAFAPTAPSDWIAFRVASRLVARSEWAAIYMPIGAATLFDVTSAFREEANADIRDDKGPAFSANALTGFVSPPPAAFLLAPLRHVSWRVSATIWRLCLALALVLAIVLADSQRTSALVWLAAAPSLLGIVYVGQPSAWVVLAATASMLPQSKRADAAGAVALALAILTKATPVIVAIGLLAAGRRRFAGWAIAIAALVVLATLPVTGFTAWARFADSAQYLGRFVLPDWPNASIESFLARSGGAEGSFVAPSTVLLIATWTIRLLLIGLVGFGIFRHGVATERRAAALWFVWIAISPLVWWHYVAALVPFLSRRPEHGLGVLCAVLIAAPPLMHALGAGSLIVIGVGVLSWTLSGALILSPAVARRWEVP